MMQSKLKKIIVALIVFVMMFSNFGYTISAIATTDGFEVIKNTFFRKEEVKFQTYFEVDGKKSDEKISDVNETVKLNMKISPNVEGYFKSATLKAVSESGDMPNFRIKDVKVYDADSNQEINKEESVDSETMLDKSNEEARNELVENIITEERQFENFVDENVINIENVENVSENFIENELDAKKEVDVTEQIGDLQTIPMNIIEKNTEENKTPINITENEEIVDVEETESQNSTETADKVESKDQSSTDIENIEQEEQVFIENEENTIENSIPNNTIEDEEILIDEEIFIEEKTEKAKEELVNISSDIQIISDNEISITNVIEETEYVLELEYVQNENLKIEDLYKEIKLQLSGIYINEDLEEVQIAKENIVNVGWKYNKDIQVKSEYTKVSPFKIGEKEGTIVENKITVKRNGEDEKYLPLKSTIVEVEIATFNEKMPINIDVYATKLMATRGEDIGEVNFSENNWVYDEENGKLIITAANEQEGIAKNTLGEDEYVIIYRFEDYTEEISSKLEKNVVVTAEQYSGLENVILTKEIKEGQEIDVNVGELITYSINANEDKIQKAKIYANYNSEEPIYETEYTSNVTVNILTSDIIEKLKIDCSKEIYKDINGYEFQATDVKYKKIKFYYNEIKEILANGGNIEIYNTNGELLYTLDNSLITSEEDCTININYADGMVVNVNNIKANGNIDFELTKVIRKSNYDKSAFKNFKQIESRIKAEIKYANQEEIITLQEIEAVKEFEESYTRANLYINKETLTTIQTNENIELKIELNNDKQDSDLYINPSFELVFPKHVKEVTVENLNLLYENGLKLSDFYTYTESDIVKVRISLEGTQTTFSESEVTNGTNILINVIIKVDEYTPSKEDQIKLYYCNEGVTNYESQTKWTISKKIPDGIIKTTNGFDVALIKYQAPQGLVTINGILNYDGNLGDVKSVKQGITMKEVALNSESRIAKMELLALNNTGNDCSDVVFLGRIPFKGNKDVISNKDLGTTVDAVMTDFIKEDIQNFNMVEIYYSENENANKNFSDGANGWKTAENVNDINKIRSFLIVVKGNVKTGSVLRFTYDFKIPENLPYETSIVGSFGAYYNNNTDVAIIYESSKADLVGVLTIAGPKIEANLSVDIGDGAAVGECRFLKYTLTVVNSGSESAVGIKVTNPLPKYGTFYEYTSDNSMGNNNYVVSQKMSMKWDIEKLDPGQTETFEYYVKTDEIPTMQEYWLDEVNSEINQDENGYYYEKIIDVEYVEKEVEKTEEEESKEENEEDLDIEEVENEVVTNETKTEETEKEIVVEEVYKTEKVYLDPVPDVYVTNKAQVFVSNLAINVESNETRNLLINSNFDIEVNTEWEPVLSVGSQFAYMSSIRNISGKTQNNVMVKLQLPNTVKYVGPEVYLYRENEKYDTEKVSYDESTHTVTFLFDEMHNKESFNAYVIVKVVNGSNSNIDSYFSIVTEDGKEEKSSIMTRTYAGPQLEINQTTNLEENKVKEGEDVELLITIENTGNLAAESISIVDEISENLEDVIVKISGCISDSMRVDGETLKYTIGKIPIKQKAVITIKGEAARLNGISKTISNFATISTEYIEKKTNVINIEIIGNPELIEKEKQEEKEREENSTQYITGPDIQNSEENQNSSNSNNSGDDSSMNDENSSNGDMTNNGNDDNINNTDNNNQNSSNENSLENSKIHSISGQVWLDTNRNGRKDENEENVSAVIVQLLKNGNMIKATTTDGGGLYKFSNLENGNYSVIFKYDEKKYIGTSYKMVNVEENLNSDAVQTANGTAVTNTFQIVDLSIENLNLGLQDRNIFDLSVNKFITSAKVKVDGKEENYNFKDLSLAKVEIPAKKIKKAIVEIEYKILIENAGNVSGKAISIVDYLPEDMKFEESKNVGWYLGRDGNVYNETLKNDEIAPGETRELTIILTKQMTEENTGVISNKVEIVKSENVDGIVEDASNNKSTQETLVSIKTGEIIIYVGIIIAGIITIASVYMIIVKKVKFKFLKKKYK